MYYLLLQFIYYLFHIFYCLYILNFSGNSLNNDKEK